MGDDLSKFFEPLFLSFQFFFTFVSLSDISVDREAIFAIVSFVWNAIEHGGDDVTVRIGIIEPNQLFIADDGSGISTEAREKVFSRGYSTATDGTGLGLSIVETICEAHGWTVTVTSSEHGGARFEITAIDIGQKN